MLRDSAGQECGQGTAGMACLCSTISRAWVGRPKRLGKTQMASWGWGWGQLLHSHVTWARVTWSLGSAMAIDQSTFMCPPHVAWSPHSMVTRYSEVMLQRASIPRQPAETMTSDMSLTKVTKASPDWRAWEIRPHLKWEACQRICNHFYNLPLPAFK